MYDLAIIGGGINGCGIARDAAGRGYKVLLAEKGDLAQGTSSGSTKLIHGGLRYLEHYEFRLVRESLQEREALLAIAPHIIWPMRFVLPHTKGLRPAWLLRTGLFLYDHIGGRRHLPPTRTLDLTQDPAGAPLKPGFATAFEYSDCWVDDARLVVLNARDAADRGATIMTRTGVERLEHQEDSWRIALRDQSTNIEQMVEARLVVNAAGPWVDDVLSTALGRNGAHNVRLVQGSHIVVPKLFDHHRSYIFQNADDRIIFAIPYETDFTLIGTTDRDYDGTLDAIAISDEETAYLCNAASEYFEKPICPKDVVWTYSAVRPLFDDGATKAQEATRDYVLKIEGDDTAPHLINIFGGKITTYRRLAQDVLDHVDRLLARETSTWTANAPLPGGDFSSDGFFDQVAAIIRDHPFLERRTAERLVRTYGTIAAHILNGAMTQEDLGRSFGADLTQREVEHLQRYEWARTTDDVLWRRTKLGLRLNADQQFTLAAWLEDSRDRSPCSPS
ncbi:MAG: glycerol-3-phosphate dehydrogenase [Hyphomicrobiaceae bacterium]